MYKSRLLYALRKLFSGFFKNTSERTVRLLRDLIGRYASRVQYIDPFAHIQAADPCGEDGFGGCLPELYYLLSNNSGVGHVL